MSNNFTAATKKIQDLMTLYNRLDSLPNRGQWRFEQTYGNYNTHSQVNDSLLEQEWLRQRQK